MKTHHKFPLVLLNLFVLCSMIFPVLAGDDDWRPINPSDLSSKEPVVEKDADAEGIFGEVKIDDSTQNLIFKHYIRVKIFTERGRDKFSKVDIPYTKGLKIKEIAARVVKPDGTIVELKKEDVFEREIVKSDDVKVKAKSFAVPGLELGSILEYRYQEFISGGAANNMRLVFQKDIPVQNISYFLKPNSQVNVKYLTFNMQGNKFEKDKGGFYRMSMLNVPALKEEPRMPPEDEIRAWILMYYSTNSNFNEDKFWANIGGLLAYVYDIKDTLKPSGELKKAIPEIIGNAATDEEKLARIYNFCRTKIKNITYDTSLTDEEKDKIKPTKSTTDTYKKLQGKSVEINELFASLAVAAGFEARIAFTGDRSKIFFSPKYQHSSFVHPAGIAVKVSEGWRYFDPGSKFVEYGTLAWFEEDTPAFLLGSKDYYQTKTPLTGIDKTVAKRTGRFNLLEDGTLEGTVRVEYTGHSAFSRRLSSYEDSASKQEEDLKAEVKERISTAEISQVTIENMDNSDKPLIYSYKIKVPSYAQKTGKRLFLQPGFFEYNVKPQFPSATRINDVYFSYPWSENDDIEIKLPKNFSLDSPDAPSPLADTAKISSLDIKIFTDKEQTVLRYSRKFHFGNGALLFPAQVYPAIKKMFDAFNQADNHTLTLRQK